MTDDCMELQETGYLDLMQSGWIRIHKHYVFPRNEPEYRGHSFHLATLASQLDKTSIPKYLFSWQAIDYCGFEQKASLGLWRDWKQWWENQEEHCREGDPEDGREEKEKTFLDHMLHCLSTVEDDDQTVLGRKEWRSCLQNVGLRAGFANSIHFKTDSSTHKCCRTALKNQAIREVTTKYQELKAIQRASRAREDLNARLAAASTLIEMSRNHRESAKGKGWE